MNLKEAAKEVLDQLQNVLDHIIPGDYTIIIQDLNGSIGEHTRHILEFYMCLINGLKTGYVNYDNRKRDVRIESNPGFAKNKLVEIVLFIERFNDNPSLDLIVSYSYSETDDICIQSNYFRELTYNIEHTIHHLAIIKSAIIEKCNYIDLPEHFGIASSTIRYRNSNK